MSYLRFLLKFGYRNIWREPKRALIMIFSLSFGTAYILWVLNFAEAGSKEVMKEFLSQYAGSYQFTHIDYYPEGNTKRYNSFATIHEDDIPQEQKINSIPRVVAPVFISGHKKTLGVLLNGTSPEKELSLSKLATSVKKGRFLDPHKTNEILIGQSLANKIDAQIGDLVALIGQAQDGSVANDLFEVVGLIDFGGGDLEDALSFTTLESAQLFFSMDSLEYHQYINFDMERSPPEATSDKLKVTTWHQLLPEISVSIRFIDGFTKTVCLVIVVVISLGLSNTLMISFFERQKEFEALNIIGANRWWILGTLIVEVFILGTIALILGLILGHIFTIINYHYPINLELFTNGKPMYLGGMLIHPYVKIFPIVKHYWQVSLLIYLFLIISMIYPSFKIMSRGKNAI